MTFLHAKDSEDKMKERFPASNMSYDKKLLTIHNLRARIICTDGSLKGLLTFVHHVVVKEGHPMFESVAYTDGDKMYFADKFFSQDVPVQCAIILHEMFHIVFRHVNRGRKRIHDLWNIACDAIINESIGFKDGAAMTGVQHAYLLKEDVVNLDSLYEEFSVPTHEHRHYSQWTSEELYEFLITKLKEKLEEQLEKQNKQEEDKNKGPKKGDQQEEDGNEDGEGGGDSDEEVDKPGDSKAKEGKKGTGGSQPSGGGKGKNQPSNSPLGKLEKEIEDLMDKLRKKHKMFSGDDMKEGEGKQGDAVNKQVNDAVWTQRYNRAKAQSSNSSNSILGRVNADVYKAQIPWHKELRKYLVKRCMPLTEQSWSRPNRRMGSIPKANRTYMPGIQNMKGLDKMMVIIDTSGSCFNEEELTMFCSEIQAIQEATNVELALIFADTEIRSEFIVKPDGTPLLDKMKTGFVKAAGGGGTDMVAPFIEGKKKYRPMLTVIASDG